jgi:hypothetical protein
MATDTLAWKEWTWPLPVWNGRKPDISNGYGTRYPDGHIHQGVDIMYHWQEGDPTRAQDKIGVSPSGKWYVPEGMSVRAVQDGEVWGNPVKTAKGIGVIIEHGPKPYTTFYQHLSKVFVKKRQSVRRGDIIGEVGAGEEAGRLRHLHFELHQWGPAKGQKTVLDPRPYMKAFWGYTDEDGNFTPGPDIPIPDIPSPGIPKVPPNPFPGMGNGLLILLGVGAGAALLFAFATRKRGGTQVHVLQPTVVHSTRYLPARATRTSRFKRRGGHYRGRR